MPIVGLCPNDESKPVAKACTVKRLAALSIKYFTSAGPLCAPVCMTSPEFSIVPSPQDEVRKLQLIPKLQSAARDRSNFQTEIGLHKGKGALRAKRLLPSRDLGIETDAAGDSVERQVPHDVDTVYIFAGLRSGNSRAVVLHRRIDSFLQNLIKHDAINFATLGLVHFVHDFERSQVDPHMNRCILHAARRKSYIPRKIADGKLRAVCHHRYHSSRKRLHREEAGFCINRKVR